MRVIALLCCVVSMAATSTAPVVSEGLATQIALDRAGFSPGEIDGRAGKNLERAMAAYKQSHEDDLSLLGDAPPLIDYTITDADVAGPFTPDIPPNLPDQAALDALNYRTPLEAIAERFHSSPTLLQKLNPAATFQKAGERIMVPNVASPAPPALPASAIGTWKVNGVQRNPKFHYNPELFWDATPGDRKATLQPGPNNPVGIVWIDLSKPHYGIHGTPEPSKIGHVESHGCVRLTNWDADRVAQWVKPGTKVVFRE